MLRQHRSFRVIAAVVLILPTTLRADGPSTRPADAARREKAIELLAKAESFPPPKSGGDSIETNLIDAHVELGQLNEAQKRLEAITDERSKVQPIIQIMTARKKSGDAAGAKALAATLKEPGDLSPLSLLDYVRVQAAAGNFRSAEKAIDLPKKGFVSMSKLDALIELASDEYRDGKKPEAVWHFDRAADIIRLNQNPADLGLDTLGLLAIEQDQAGDHAGAAEVLKSDPNAEDALKALVQIAVSNYAAADHDQMVDLLARLNKSLAAKKDSGDVQPDLFATIEQLGDWYLLAQGWTKTGNREKAQAALNSAIAISDRLAGLEREYHPEWPLVVAGEMACEGDRVGALKVIEREIAKSAAMPKQEAASALWEIAIDEAQTDLADDAPRVIALAFKGGPTDTDLTITPSIGPAARGIAAHSGTAADLSWIESLPTDDAKAAAYAGAAAGMADTSSPEH